MHNKTDDKALPMSSESMAGMTPGSQGDASRADVTRGYSLIDKGVVTRGPMPPPDEMFDDYVGSIAPRGFAGRPEGFER